MRRIRWKLFLLLTLFAAVLIAVAFVVASRVETAATMWPAALFLLVASVLFSWIVASLFATPIERLDEVIDRLAQGDFSPRLRLDREDELAHIAESVSAIASAGQSGRQLSAIEQEQAAEILAVMRDGVLVVDTGGRIVRANEAADRLLHAPLQASTGRRFVGVARGFPALSFVAQALSSGKPITEQVEMPEGQTFVVQAVPLRFSPRADLDRPPSTRQALIVIRDTTERMRIERMRRDFVANVSHELKTPLAGLSLLAATLKQAMAEDPEQAREFAVRLGTEVNRLSDLVDDLLALSTFEEQPHTATATAAVVDLAEIVRETAAGLGDESSGRAMHLDLETPALVRGKAARLTIMARNLIDNALRFTDEGGNVWLTVEPAGNKAVLTVRDDGIGIPRASHSRIFERFYRLDKARSRATGGTGLGLSIVKHIAESHGGSVAVKSRLGAGSTFTVHLPLASREGLQP